MARNLAWHPPRSPWGLIQEDLFPDEWKCIVVCILLNCTSRKQIEKILPEFFKRWPKPESLLAAEFQEIQNLISSLGFGHRRTKRLRDMSEMYLRKDWKHVSELPGVGEYAARMWEIFFLGKLGEDAPKDGALKIYWSWLKLLQWKLLIGDEFLNDFVMNKER